MSTSLLVFCLKVSSHRLAFRLQLMGRHRRAGHMILYVSKTELFLSRFPRSPWPPHGVYLFTKFNFVSIIIPIPSTFCPTTQLPINIAITRHSIPFTPYTSQKLHRNPLETYQVKMHVLPRKGGRSRPGPRKEFKGRAPTDASKTLAPLKQHIRSRIGTNKILWSGPLVSRNSRSRIGFSIVTIESSKSINSINPSLRPSPGVHS